MYLCERNRNNSRFGNFGSKMQNAGKPDSESEAITGLLAMKLSQ